ncbi:uncharacterized protein [Panulirus ornatus]|uniref:uncharacterized protein n=1 Tax=Panulirus ornatus TaxID=150431 RepID=UPI003A8B4ED3
MATVEEEQLDPRVQIELEKLNTATDDINKLEAKLEEANNVFRTTLTESTARLKTMAKKLGSCIEKARPYFEAQELARTSQLDCQRAAVQYQRANALHQAAKETIALAEERFINSRHEHWQFDSAWQEMLNHATMKVMEAEAQKAASEREHMRRASVYQQTEQRVQQLQRGLRSSINKSLVYFEEKARVQAQLESQKERVQQLQQAIAASKSSYAQSLRSLEQISEQIHEQRRCRLPREPGVGAELTPPEVADDLSYDHSARPFTPLEEMTAQEEKYWESLREKLEKLHVDSPQGTVSASDEAPSGTESTEGRERTVTGSSFTSSNEPENVVGTERVVSGESSHGSESDDTHNSIERKDLPLNEVLTNGSVDTGSKIAEKSEVALTEHTLFQQVNVNQIEIMPDWDNVKEEYPLSRRTPVGGHAFEVVDDLHTFDDKASNFHEEVRTEISSLKSNDFVVNSLLEKKEGVCGSQENVCLRPKGNVNDTKLAVYDYDKLNSAMNVDECTNDNISDIDKDIEKGNELQGLLVRNWFNEKLYGKEEGDGSSSPPPAMCQLSRD